MQSSCIYIISLVVLNFTKKRFVHLSNDYLLRTQSLLIVSPTGGYQHSFIHLTTLMMSWDRFHSCGSINLQNSSSGGETEARSVPLNMRIPYDHMFRMCVNIEVHHQTTEVNLWTVKCNDSRAESTLRRITVARTLCPLIDDDGLSVLLRSGVTHMHTHTPAPPSSAGCI